MVDLDAAAACVHAGCRRHLDKCPSEDPDTMVNMGCVLFKEGQYEAARAKFQDAIAIIGYQVKVMTIMLDIIGVLVY